MKSDHALPPARPARLPAFSTLPRSAPDTGPFRPLRLGLFGRGRLAGTIAAAAPSRGFEVIFSLGREDTPPSFAEHPVDVAIDASGAEAVPRHLHWALEKRCPLVVGTTGWSFPDLESRIDGRIGVLVAPNFSLGVALVARLSRVLGRFAALDPQRDLYLLEKHHARKADAPSGTARLLARELAAGGSRSAEGIPIGVVRAGSEPGSHTVGLDHPFEVIELHHRARQRDLFAQGALDSARWLVGRQGLFHFDDFARTQLDPLFRFDA